MAVWLLTSVQMDLARHYLSYKVLKVPGKQATILAYATVFMRKGCWLSSAACLTSTGSKLRGRLPCSAGMMN